jgi:hypothetical protein
MMRCNPDESGCVMEVASWLRSLGLGQYAATFREAEIDAEILDALDTQSDRLGCQCRIHSALRQSVLRSLLQRC